MIYADLLFLINFLADFLIFLSVSILKRQKTGLIRMVISASFSALSYCLAIIFMKGNLFIINISMAVAVYFCFKPKSIKAFAVFIGYSCISAIMTGGIFSALWFTVRSGERLSFSFPIMIISAVIMYFSVKIIASSVSKKQTICNIKIITDKKSISAKGLIDTGNSLCEPYTGKPVTIISEKCVRDIAENKPCIYIPFKSIGNKNGLLKAFTAERLEIEAKNKETVENAVIAIADFNIDSEFDAVLNPKIIKGGI